MLAGLEASEAGKEDINDVARQLSQVVILLRQRAEDAQDAMLVADRENLEQLVMEHKDIMDEIRASERWLKVWFNPSQLLGSCRGVDALDLTPVIACFGTHR